MTALSKHPEHRGDDIENEKGEVAVVHPDASDKAADNAVLWDDDGIAENEETVASPIISHIVDVEPDDDDLDLADKDETDEKLEASVDAPQEATPDIPDEPSSNEPPHPDP
mmetsp:Transcript_4928/g.9400  ORF Transcript_4928/g.9400 Transcript_4928/m.9400 type:complete len:111 (+) Transcript_4928:751-1083(+)